MSNNPEINPDGDKFWTNEEGHLHREDGPAVEYADGSQDWCLNGELHRDNGPAIIDIAANKFLYRAWYFEGNIIE